MVESECKIQFLVVTSLSSTLNTLAIGDARQKVGPAVLANVSSKGRKDDARVLLLVVLCCYCVTPGDEIGPSKMLQPYACYMVRYTVFGEKHYCTWDVNEVTSCIL
jgi:hypothetical protein